MRLLVWLPCSEVCNMAKLKPNGSLELTAKEVKAIRQIVFENSLVYGRDYPEEAAVLNKRIRCLLPVLSDTQEDGSDQRSEAKLKGGASWPVKR